MFMYVYSTYLGICHFQTLLRPSEPREASGDTRERERDFSPQLTDKEGNLGAIK